MAGCTHSLNMDEGHKTTRQNKQRRSTQCNLVDVSWGSATRSAVILAPHSEACCSHPGALNPSSSSSLDWVRCCGGDEVVCRARCRGCPQGSRDLVSLPRGSPLEKVHGNRYGSAILASMEFADEQPGVLGRLELQDGMPDKP